MNLKDVDPNNFTQVEQYADSVIAAILDASDNDRNIMLDLFRDHIISMISPNYFEEYRKK